MAAINVPGLPGNQATPGVYIHTAFAQGPASSGAGSYSVILIGNKTSVGSADENVVYGPDLRDTEFSSMEHAEELFGKRSPLYRMAKRFLSVNQVTKLYAVCVPVDGYAAQAEGDITVVGTATAFGTLRVFVGDEYVDVGFATGDTETVIAENAVGLVNSKSDWPVEASSVAGVLTLTAACPGVRGNLIRISAKVLPSGTGITVGPLTPTVLAGGTVEDDNSAALAAILATGLRFYYHVSEADDTTQLNNVIDQINAQGVATIGIRQRLIAASVDSLATTTSKVTSLNNERTEMIWQKSSDWTPGELAANVAAVYTFEEQGAAFRLNFNGYGNDPDTSNYWRVPAPRTSGVAPTPLQIEAALNSGITPIKTEAGGKTSLVKRITTRFKSGAVVDYRIRESHKVTVEDRFADDLGIATALVMAGKQIATDPVANDPPVPGAMTPTAYRALVFQLIREYDANGRLQDAAKIILETVVQIEPATPDRISALVPLRPINIWNSTAIRVDQVA